MPLQVMHTYVKIMKFFFLIVLIQIFTNALEWIQSKGEIITPISVVSLIQNCLTQLNHTITKCEFCVKLLNGFGSVLTSASRKSFSEQVLEWTDEFIPDTSKILYCYYNASRNCIDTYQSEYNEDSYIVKTAQMKLCIDILKTWINSQESFILIGPQGSGKSKLLNHCISEYRGTEILTVHCTSHISPEHILQKLGQVCMNVSGNSGMIFRPKNADRLILHLKDLNLAVVDKWGSNILVSFLHQILSYKGFYDPTEMEWINMEQVQLVFSMITCENLNSRFINCNRLITLCPPDQEDLVAICTSYLRPLAMPEKLMSVVCCIMTAIYSQLKDAFDKSQVFCKFNLRDLCNWCTGLKRYVFSNNQEIIRALLYEGNRLFRDRLENEVDKCQFSDIVKTILETELGQSSLVDKIDDMVFICEDPNRQDSRTLKLLEPKEWLQILMKHVLQPENEGDFLNKKILLPQTAKIVAYFERVLTLPGGSLFLPGFSGFGRKSAVRIVAARHSAKLFSPKVSTRYGLNNFKNDLKMVLQSAGLDGQTIYVILEDYQIVNDTMLDFINSLLTSGEIPGLYQPEEFETLCSPLKDIISKHGFQGTPGQFFLKRIKKNIHIILIVDMKHGESTNLWKSNPILFRRCQTIWLFDWSEETKLSVLRSTFEREGVKENDVNDADGKHEIDVSLWKYFLEINENAKNWMSVTPRHFSLFIRTYLQIKQSKEKSIVENERKLKAGLSKLTEARSVVAELKKDAAIQESKLAEKQSKANVALNLITETMQNASSRKTEMEAVKKNMEKENETLAARKKEIDIEVAEVEPILAEARSAIGNIRSESLSEIRSLRAPPDVIRDILEGVLRLMGIQDTSWNSMKTFLAKRGVKEDIRCFDARSISSENRALVEELLLERPKSFEEKAAKRASAAAAPLARWIIANVKYAKILEKIQPLELEQVKLQKKLKNSEDEITLLSSGLDDVNQNVNLLKEQLTSNTKEAAEIQIHLSKVKNIISTAEGLVTKLDEEYSRWSEQVLQLSLEMARLPYYSIISSAIIIYLSYSSEDVRRDTLNKWKKLVNLEEFHFEKFLSSELEQLRWLSEGLPSDYLSIQNAVIISQTFLTPFLIDPSDIAFTWLQNYLKEKGMVDVVSSDSPQVHTSLELAIRFGKSLIIRDVITLDPILVPILCGNFILQGIRKLIPIGDKLIDYNASFRLFLVCRDPKTVIPSYFASLLTTVNFEVTYSGLSQQLLRRALSVEKPDLERKRVELSKKEDQLKTKLFALQDNILAALANARGNVLENTELLETLKESKNSGSEIEAALTESQKVRDKLTDECQVYKPIAESAATLYFSILSLQSINNFYQISIDTFIRIYETVFPSIQGLSDFDTDKKLRKLIQQVHQYIGRFLFKEDLLTFVLHVIRDMYPQLFQPNEWELFNREVLVNAKVDSPEVIQGLPPWANKEQAFEIFLLRNTLPALYDKLQVQNTKLWENFIKGDSSSIALPLSPFQVVLVTQAFKPGFLHSTLVEFAQKVLGLRRLSPNSLQLDKLLNETDCNEPVLLIVSPGVDPSEELRSLAKTHVGSNFYEVALGRGQTDHILQLLRESAARGHWLILKNLHLMTSWLPSLEKEYRSLNKFHDTFRLWLTSEPHSNFPSTLIRFCSKVTYEAPQGIKCNLEKTYRVLTDVSFSSVEHARTVFVLAWFHAIAQERRTFIPQGWCKFYEFNDSDFFAALRIIQKRFLSDNKNSVKWNYIHDLYEQAIYGGRIDNFQDLRVLRSYLRTYFNDEIVSIGNKLLARDVRIPRSTALKDYYDAIQKIPETNLPELFALPLNVDLSWQKKRSSDVINWLKILRNQNVILNKSSIEEWKSKISPVLHLWKHLNQEVGILKMKNPPEEAGDITFRKFCSMEVNFAIALVGLIHRTLVDLNRLIRNYVTPNEKAVSLIIEITNQKTPDEWLSVWEGNKNPILYIRSVMNRSSSIMKLYKENDSMPNVISKPVDLKQFFNPQTFLSIFKIHSSRLNQNPLDNLRLECSWKDGVRNANATLTITNLLMEGAYIQAGSLCKNSADSPTRSLVPDFKIAWLANESHSYDTENKLFIPVYHDSSREHILMFVDIDVLPQCHNMWLQANVSAYLQE